MFRHTSTDLIFTNSRQLVTKVTCHWPKTTVKAVFNAFYGAHPLLEYPPAVLRLSMTEPIQPIGLSLSTGSDMGAPQPTVSTASGLTSTAANS